MEELLVPKSQRGGAKQTVKHAPIGTKTVPRDLIEYLQNKLSLSEKKKS